MIKSPRDRCQTTDAQPLNTYTSLDHAGLGRHGNRRVYFAPATTAPYGVP